MSQENNISFQLTAEDLQAVKDAIQVITTTLGPKLIQLSADDRQSLTKMGEKSLSFVTKSAEYMNTQPDLTPNYVDATEMALDVKAVEDIRQLLQELNPLVNGLEDTMMLSGSEAIVTALSYYSYVKVASNSKVPGAETIYNDLKSRFPRRRKKSDVE